MTKITVKTKGFTDILDITGEVEKIVEKQKVKDGLVNIFAVGSTVGVTTIEADPNLYKDLTEALEQFAPMKKKWRHGATWGEDNGASHIRSSIFGTSLTIPFSDKKMALGTWQKIAFIDFDTTARTREVVVTIISV
jgi:secondary thiamine-phosphate synthase enzyme